MKLLLVNISKNWSGRVYREYPLGLGLLGTIASRDGHSVRVFDMALENTSLDEAVSSFQPDIIGISFLSIAFPLARQIINHISSTFEGHIISGGIHSSLFPKQVLDIGVDVVVRNEAEDILTTLLANLEAISKGNYGRSNTFRAIPNISYYDVNREYIANRDATTSVDINNLPMIDRELYNLNLYSHHSVISSRGCVHNCRFCCSWGPGALKGRTRAPLAIAQEMRHLVENYQANLIYWADDMFFFNKNSRLHFCDLMCDMNLPMEWIVQLRADDIDRELASNLSKAGCSKISIGAESGSESILRTCGKRITPKDISESICIAKEAGLRVKTWWVVGLPGGDLGEQKKALDIIQQAMPHEVAIHTFVPLPGSHFWNNHREYGIHLPSEEDYDSLFYYSEPNLLHYDYMTSEECLLLLQEYNDRLELLGYLPTDKGTGKENYLYTSPLQGTTFKV